MMLALLIYSYATGTFGRAHRAEHLRQCAGAPAHRRHASRSRHDLHLPPREPGAVDRELCPVLQLAQQLKVLQVGQITVAVDGTKVLANASKHSAVSYERAGQ